MKKFRIFLIFALLFSITFAYGSLPKPDSDHAAYIIKDGDSLWEITDRFYKNPFLWPRLWEVNPYIDDPNVIYPGDIVSLWEDSLIKLNPKTRTDGLIEIDPPPPVFYYSPGGGEGFVNPDEWEHMGTIISAEPPRLIYSEGDMVYVNIGSKDRVRVGDMFTIFRSSKEVRHPHSGKRVGYKVAIQGQLEITEILEKKLSVAKIIDSRREITKGSRIRPIESFVTEVVIKRGKNKTDGYVIANKSLAQLSGAGDVIYVDVGREKNVEPGNTMTIYTLPRKVLDPDSGKRIKIPGTHIGKIVLLNVGEETSTGIVVESKRQINIGDRVTLDL